MTGLSGPLRAAAIVVHRWLGLSMGAFLLVAGLTGSVLSFFAELDAALNPELFSVEAPPGAKLLDAIELQSRLRRQLPSGEVLDSVVLDLRPGRAVNYWVGERETFVDPYSGSILGSRRFGDLGEGKKNLLTFVYRLHYSLGLGDVGVWIFGGVALLWTLDCFVGAYLTFPRADPKGRISTKSWLARWLPAWFVKTNRLFSLVFTWHRASGLWVWGMLLVFAWSGVALNLGEQVYDPVMSAVLGERRRAEPPKLAHARTSPKLDSRAALTRGRAVLAEQARRRGFRVLREKWLAYDAERGVYSYTVDSTLDVDERLAETEVKLDGDDGRLLSFNALSGGTLRHTLDSWLVALHFGAVRGGGVAYRAFVSCLGLAVALLSVTGVWIWWRKRQKRVAKPERAA